MQQGPLSGNDMIELPGITASHRLQRNLRRQSAASTDIAYASTCNDAVGTLPSVGAVPAQRPMGRSHSAVELHHMGSLSHAGSSNDLRQLEQVILLTLFDT